MHSQGVTVAYNSDDAEMSRRLNQEAAKQLNTVEFRGRCLEICHLKSCEIIAYRRSSRSVKVGKSADLVLWSDHPMSIYAVAEKTMIEGIFYYELDRATAQVDVIQQERNLSFKKC